jgi:parallel beta-helix repeat protein
MRCAALRSLAVFSFVFVGVTAAGAEDISGTITATKVIFEDSQLVGDVTCTMTDGPCIDFGASHIKLRLNGFTMTGPALPDNAPDPANPSAFCNATSGLPQADGIRIANQTHAQILGPGMVQKFRRHGIFISGTGGVSTRAKVRLVTSHHNCFSGLLTNLMTDSIIEEIVSVRNANNSGAAPCGGNCLVNSHDNRIRRNQFSGNGSVSNNNNDFGVGLLFGSSGNIVEDNSIGGNTNGILIQANAVDNVIRRNVIAGNPPAQVSRTFGAAIGFDVKDESSAPGTGDRNTFERNWCVTYSGPGPAPCPSFPGPQRGGEDRR